MQSPPAPAQEDVGGCPEGTGGYFRHGMIEESHNKWRNPIVLVPKPNGSIWFSIDFRKVNNISLLNAYPIL